MDRRTQIRRRAEHIEVDIMDIGQIIAWIDAMPLHQARQRGAMAAPVFVTQLIGTGVIAVQHRHDIGGHPRLDLREKRHFRRVKRVIQIKDPDIDMCEIHAPRIQIKQRPCNRARPGQVWRA